MAKGKYHDWITKEGLTKIQGWARDGLSNEQIAHNVGINAATIYEWMKKYPKFGQALKKGKEVIDREVENALLKRALGYEYIETKEYIEKTDDGKAKKRIEKFTKKMAPDTTAQIFWLKNRKPRQWRDRQDVQLGNNEPININIITEKNRSKLDDDKN